MLLRDPNRCPSCGERVTPYAAGCALCGDFYLRAYGDDAGQAQEALAAARLAGCPEAGDLLDVPCGFGRHSVPLARAGYRVVGVDRAEPLLAEARRRAGG